MQEVESDRKSEEERAKQCRRRRRKGTENMRRKVLNSVGGEKGPEK